METTKRVGKQQPQVEIDFTIHCAHTKPGETVKVTGNTVELGNWNPVYGLDLKTGPSYFPKWNGGTAKFINGPEKLEYKYLIVKEADGQVIQWEPFAGNREVTINQAIKVHIEDSYGIPQHLKVDFTQAAPI